MIEGLKIQNYRGANSIELSNFRTLNIFTGANGSGKTTLLEAIFLACGNSPELYFRSRQFRGREMAFETEQNRIKDTLLSDIFFDATLQSLKISVFGSPNVTRQLTVTFEEAPSSVSLNPGEPRDIDLGVSFAYEIAGREKQTSQMVMRGSQLVFDPVSSQMSVNFLPARLSISERENARLYSDLRISGGADNFEAALLSEFPMLTELSVETPAGTQAIFGKLKNGKRLPLTMVSSGINQLAAILLRLCSVRGTVLLIDEIENGFFHDRLSSIWSAIYKLARLYDGQVFATTHSLECIKALKQAVPEHAGDVAFYRARLGHSGIECRRSSGEATFDAVDSAEVR